MPRGNQLVRQWQLRTVPGPARRAHGGGRRGATVRTVWRDLRVWDGRNNKLVGLIALADPVFNLAVRDKHIGWAADDRRKRLAHVLDAYVLGALPPYNMLLGGKLVAALVGTQEVRDAFARKYSGVRGLISGEVKPAALHTVCPRRFCLRARKAKTTSTPCSVDNIRFRKT